MTIFCRPPPLSPVDFNQAPSNFLQTPPLLHLPIPVLYNPSAASSSNSSPLRLPLRRVYRRISSEDFDNLQEVALEARRHSPNLGILNNNYPCRVDGCNLSFRQAMKRDCHEAVQHQEGDCYLCQCGFVGQGSFRFTNHIQGALKHHQFVSRAVANLKANGHLPHDYQFRHDRFIMKNCNGFVERHGDYVQHYAATIVNQITNHAEQVLLNRQSVMENPTWREYISTSPSGHIISARHGVFNPAVYYDG